MITNGILLVLQGVVNILLAPLTIINIAVDFVAAIPVITQFIQVVAYVLPWGNLLPLVVLTIALFVLRIAISLIKTIWNLIPFT